MINFTRLSVQFFVCTRGELGTWLLYHMVSNFPVFPKTLISVHFMNGMRAGSVGRSVILRKSVYAVAMQLYVIHKLLIASIRVFMSH